MYNYKHKMYANEGEVVIIDGKVSAARIVKYRTNGMWRCQTLYYMFEGVMYSTNDIFHEFFGEEQQQFLNGKVHEIVKKYGCNHAPCSTFLQDFKVMRSRKKFCTAIAVGNEHAELVHFKNPTCINVHSTRLRSGYNEFIEYDANGFIYSIEEHDMSFTGFPDLQDTSIHMNILMMSGKVEVMQELVDLFKYYTSRMHIDY